MAGRPKTVATISSLQLIVNHFMSAPLAEAKHDIDVAQAIVIGRAKASGTAIPTGVPTGATAGGARKRDRSGEKARAAANRAAAAGGGTAVEGATEGTTPKRKRGRPSNADKTNGGAAGAETLAGDATSASVADVAALPLPDAGGPMGDDATA